MKRIWLISLLFLTAMILKATIHEVAIDGTQNWPTISYALEYCISGDTILVHPGHYNENLNFSGKDITLLSTFILDNNPEHIETTVIDGNLDKTIYIPNQETVIIDGFTITNNDEHNFYNGIWGASGIQNEGNLVLKNSIVRDCTNGDGGGIISIETSSLTLENVSIYNNIALGSGGGIYIISGCELELINTSIYNNVASYGMDIGFSGSEDNLIEYNINLIKGSIALNEYDDYFIMASGNYRNYYDDYVSVNIESGYFEEIDEDLFVSPNGNDSNSGLSETEPLKTITRGLQLIKANENNRNTLHLMPGTYKQSEGQITPVGIKSNIIVQGYGIGETILDGEETTAFLHCAYQSNIEISDITFRDLRSVYWSINGSLSFQSCQEAIIKDLEFDNCLVDVGSGIYVVFSENVNIENILIHNVTNSLDWDSAMAIAIKYSDNIMCNNIIYTNSSFTGLDKFFGYDIDDADVELRNCIISNIQAEEGSIFQYDNMRNDYGLDNEIEIHNMLVFNNEFEIRTINWPFKLFNIHHLPRIYNSTFANNSVNKSFVTIYGGVEVFNSIFYNPESWGDFGIANDLPYYDPNHEEQEAFIYNSLINNDNYNLFATYIPELVQWEDNLIGQVPLFAGEFNDSLDVSDVEYYELAEQSPCIDAGHFDTSFLLETDLAGNQRVWGGAVDMGAFEFGAPAVANYEEEVEAVKMSNISVYPNPVNLSGKASRSSCSIEFVIPKQTDKPVVSIYNIKGQKVSSWRVNNSYQDMQKHAGLRENNSGKQLYSTIWNMKNSNNRPVASGLYLIRAETDNYAAVGKMIIIK